MPNRPSGRHSEHNNCRIARRNRLKSAPDTANVELRSGRRRRIDNEEPFHPPEMIAHLAQLPPRTIPLCQSEAFKCTVALKLPPVPESSGLMLMLTVPNPLIPT
jgi:hypothetical protein